MTQVKKFPSPCLCLPILLVSGKGVTAMDAILIYIDSPLLKPYSLLLMTILSQSFFAFVSGHLMTFPFLSAWHNYYCLC